MKYNTSQVTAGTSVAEMVDILHAGPPGPWPGGWAGWDNVRQAHIQLMKQVIQSTPSYPEGRYHGRGIVSCVSAKPGISASKHLKDGHLPTAWVMVKELRRLGCQLPVTFCHMGPLEWDPSLTALVKPLGVSVLDLHQCLLQDPARILASWESKVYAIVQSPYEEVLFLDADNIPLCDPTVLFDLPHIREYGAILWPDVPPYDRTEWLPKEVWHNIDMPHMPHVKAAESGQLLINKRTWWRELVLCRWMNEHSDWFYKFVFGDKDTFVLAGQRIYWEDPINQRLNYYMIPHGAGGPGSSLVHYDVERKAIFQHCTRNKATLEGYPDAANILPRDFAEKHLEELRSLWCGRLWRNVSPSDEERQIMDSLREGTWMYEREKLDKRPMRFLTDNRIGLGLKACETDWDVFVDEQGPMLAISGIDGSPTCMLRKQEEIWVGRWLQHEKCPVRLIPQNCQDKATVALS